MWILVGVVFEVGILDDAELPARGLDRCSDGRALALIPVVTEQPYDVRMKGSDLLHDFGGAIGGGVIDHNDFAADLLRERRAQNSFQQGTNEFFFVIKGHQDREKRHRYASSFLTTSPCTSVSRKCRPCNLY